MAESVAFVKVVRFFRMDSPFSYDLVSVVDDAIERGVGHGWDLRCRCACSSPALGPLAVDEQADPIPRRRVGRGLRELLPRARAKP